MKWPCLNEARNDDRAMEFIGWPPLSGGDKNGDQSAFGCASNFCLFGGTFREPHSGQEDQRRSRAAIARSVRLRSGRLQSLWSLHWNFDFDSERPDEMLKQDGERSLH